MLSKNTETYLDTDADSDDDLQPILDSIQYLELETSKLGHFKISNLLKKARTQGNNQEIMKMDYLTAHPHIHEYLPVLQNLKEMQKSLEDAGLCDESEILKLAIMSLFCKYDMQNEVMKKMN